MIARLIISVVSMLALFNSAAQSSRRGALLTQPVFAGGAPAPWTPFDEGTNVLLWIDWGSNFVASAGNFVTITNIVGTNVLTASSDPAQATLGDNAAATFDSTDFFDFGSIGSGTGISSNTPLTLVFVVANYTASASTFNTMWSYGPSVANQRFQLGTPSNSTNLAHRASSPMSASPAQPMLASTTNLAVWTWGGTGSAQDGLVSFLNGAAGSTYTGGTIQWSAPQPGRLNNYTGGGQSPTAATYGGFLVIYGTNVVTRQKAEGWIVRRHNLLDQLDAGHPYKSVAP
jgi:hypothetical protein